MALALERAWRSLATRLCFRSPTRNAPGGHATPTAVTDEETEEEEDCESPVSTWRLSRSGSRSSTNVCAICLGGMRAGKAVFTAECCHKFHFHCISSNVEQGSHVCPICRAVWTELPLQAHGTTKINPLGWPQERRLISRVNRQYGTLPVFHESRPELGTGRTRAKDAAVGYVEIMVYTEVPAIQKSVTRETFDILIHLKAPSWPTAAMPASWPRAAIDLVAVLDVSGGTAGTKLVLLKRAMSFVIQSLGPNDRLCVLTSGHSACRLFPFRKMTASGQQQSVQDIAGCLSTADGGSDIDEALRKAGRATEDRQARNPACGIILLSGSQDNHGGSWRHRDYYIDSVLRSVRPGSGHHVRIHAFGFGVDHGPKAMAMRAVAEASGGTFSFIGDAGSITDEFARCIGDLRGVVARETRLSIGCVQQGVLLSSVRSGGCASTVDDERRCGSVDVGDLYAGEERDFLVTVHVPAVLGGQDDSALIMPSCTYRRAAPAAVTMDTELVRVESNPAAVRRPTHLVSSSSVASLEVERERQRLYAVKDIAAARDAAEQGRFARALSILEGRRRKLESRAMLWADARTLAFVAEVREMEDRVVTRRRYEETGRAYILAGLSAHSWQRQRGADSTDGLTHSYQAPCMLDMLSRSQRLLPEAVQEMNHSPESPGQQIQPICRPMTS